MEANAWILIGTSAAIGALVSSVIAEIGKWRERKAKREELLLSKAIEMAHARFEHLLAEEFSGKVMPEIEMTAMYHRWLSHLLDKGKLPADYKSKASAKITDASSLNF